MPLINSIQQTLRRYDYLSRTAPLSLSLSCYANYCGVALMGIFFSPSLLRPTEPPAPPPPKPQRLYLTRLPLPLSI